MISRAIAIPTYNRLDHLEQSLDSLYSQNPELLKLYDVYIYAEPNKEIHDFLRKRFKKKLFKSVHMQLHPRSQGLVKNTSGVVRWAFSKGADFVLYLEDDIVLGSDVLELAEYYYSNYSRLDNFLWLVLFNKTQGGRAEILKPYPLHHPWGVIYPRAGWEKYRETWEAGGHFPVYKKILERGEMVLQPEVSRARNIGVTGTNMTKSLYELQDLHKTSVYLGHNNINYKFMAQFGEDQYIEKYLVDNKIMVPPFFVDIGAGDGENISNSKLFIEKYNFAALLTDANGEVLKQAADKYKDNPNVLTHQAAFTGKDEFYRIKPQKGHWTVWCVETSKTKKKGFEPTSRIGTLIPQLTKELNKQNKDYEYRRDCGEIGIMSIDVEDQNMNALQDLASSSVRPLVIVAEGDNRFKRDGFSEIEKLFADEYAKLDIIGGVNIVLVRKDINDYKI